MNKKVYISPLTEVILIDDISHFMSISITGNAGSADDGGIIGDEESKSFSLYKYDIDYYDSNWGK